MKIAVIGAGAIGGLIAGYLKQKGEDVSLLARNNASHAIRGQGLCISGVRGEVSVKVDVFEALGFNPDIAILSTKTQDIDAALGASADHLREALVVTTQNGVRADELASRYIDRQRIISSIVMFGATSLEPGRIVHNFEGSWIIGRAWNNAGADEQLEAVAGVLGKIFPAVVSGDIRGMKYLKIFVNANNCIPAVLGMSMQEAFRDPRTSAVSIALWKEGLGVIGKTGIHLAPLPDFPLERLIRLTSIPLEEAAGIFSKIMTSLSTEPVYGSVLQSIKRGRPSEIDYLNGEFVSLAKTHNAAAPLNEKLVEMVHAVERTGRFFSREELLGETSGLMN